MWNRRAHRSGTSPTACDVAVLKSAIGRRNRRASASRSMVFGGGIGAREAMHHFRTEQPRYRHSIIALRYESTRTGLEDAPELPTQVDRKRPTAVPKTAGDVDA
jgi:hypothetical protein